jgi:hypothetical protein
MTSIFRKSAVAILGAALVVVTFAWDGQIDSITDAKFVAPAYARVGNPMTPVSYAGVARRSTRRAVVATSAAAASQPSTTVVVAAPPPAPTTQTCTDSTDANGNITRTCN